MPFASEILETSLMLLQISMHEESPKALKQSLHTRFFIPSSPVRSSSHIGFLLQSKFSSFLKYCIPVKSDISRAEAFISVIDSVSFSVMKLSPSLSKFSDIKFLKLSSGKVSGLISIPKFVKAFMHTLLSTLAHESHHFIFPLLSE